MYSRIRCTPNEGNPAAHCQHQSNGITCSEVRTLIVKRVQLMQTLHVLPKKVCCTVSPSCRSIRQCNRPSYLSTQAASHVSACADRQSVHSSTSFVRKHAQFIAAVFDQPRGADSHTQHHQRQPRDRLLQAVDVSS